MDSKNLDCSRYVLFIDTIPLSTRVDGNSSHLEAISWLFSNSPYSFILTSLHEDNIHPFEREQIESTAFLHIRMASCSPSSLSYTVSYHNQKEFSTFEISPDLSLTPVQPISKPSPLPQTPNPHSNLTFKLERTDAQEHARNAVDLPYFHQTDLITSTTPLNHFSESSESSEDELDDDLEI